MEEKIRNALLDMMGDWHDVNVKLERHFCEYYYKIIIDHEWVYTMHENMCSEMYFNSTIEHIIYQFEHDVKVEVMRGD